MKLTVTPTTLPEVLVIKPAVFHDNRGYFFESFNAVDFEQLTGIKTQFVQDNHSLSTQYVLRGLHFQWRHPQGKLIRVVRGQLLSVAVDIRFDSPHFGQWVAMRLSAHNKQQLWVPPGFAYGFMVMSKQAECLYKITDYWYAQDQRCIIWNDPTINIDWPHTCPILSVADQLGMSLKQWQKQHDR